MCSICPSNGFPAETRSVLPTLGFGEMGQLAARPINANADLSPANISYIQLRGIGLPGDIYAPLGTDRPASRRMSPPRDIATSCFTIHTITHIFLLNFSFSHLLDMGARRGPGLAF